MGKIHKLEQLTALQIAAGEVIDRPAAVIRELLENAIDAGSDQVKIELFDGGLRKMIITDNGHGISKDDLPLSVERHATSKIEHIQDLNGLSTLGFRGEALASIASVAKLTIISKPKEQELAWQLKTDGLDRQICEPTAGVEGTQMVVEDLFYLTPARRKFLKKHTTEYVKVDEVLKKIALANMGFELTFKHQNKIVRQIPRAMEIKSAKSRIESLMGPDFILNATFLEHSSQMGSIQAWIAHPKYSRARSDMQFIILNQRVIKDPAIANAIKRAFQDVMMVGRYPALVLYLNIDPSVVDFNVHPTKEQVKFQDIKQITQWIVSVLKSHIMDMLSPGKQVEVPSYVSYTHHEMPVLETATVQSAPQPMLEPQTPQTNRFEFKIPQQPVEAMSINSTPTVSPTQSPTHEQINLTPNTILGEALHHLGKRYILAESSDGLIVIDAHAAHERILYEQMKEEYHQQGVQVQKLLVPIILSLDDSQCAVIEQFLPVIEQFGFEMKKENGAYQLSGYPKLLYSRDAKELFIDVLSDLIVSQESHKIQTQVENILATIACHRSVRTNRLLSKTEMNHLLRLIEKTNLANVCNHGRPTWIKLSTQHIDNLFHRD